MKRKVIKQGRDTLTITLPSKWCSAVGVKAGDEIELNQQENKLVIISNNTIELNKTTIDISNLDFVSLRKMIRSAYKTGYDEIEITFSNDKVIEYKTNKEWRINDAIYYEVKMLPGIEIINYRNGYCLLKGITEISSENFLIVLRRVFLLIDNFFENTIRGIKQNDKEIFMNSQNEHDTITNFINFCIRSLNKSIHKDFKKIVLLYHIIEGLDGIVDSLKWINRDLLKVNQKFTRECTDYIELLHKDFKRMYDHFYNYDTANLQNFIKNKYHYYESIRDKLGKVNHFNQYLILRMESIVDILYKVYDSINGIELSKELK